jgi:hypothetical protein
MPGSLSDLLWRNACVEPERYSRVPQVVGTASQGRCNLFGRERDRRASAHTSLIAVEAMTRPRSLLKIRPSAPDGAGTGAATQAIGIDPRRPRLQLSEMGTTVG